MKKNKRGALVVFSGPSGSGKGTILGRVLQERDDTVVSVSATTRLPRTGEVDGVHYFFKTREQFESMIAGDELLEWAQYSDNYYGTPKAFLEENLSAGRNVVLEIEVQGAHKVFEAFPEVASVFICIPSLQVLE
jgi:guanylate kinase